MTCKSLQVLSWVLPGELVGCHFFQALYSPNQQQLPVTVTLLRSEQQQTHEKNFAADDFGSLLLTFLGHPQVATKNSRILSVSAVWICGTCAMAVVGEAVTVGENQMVVGTPVANDKANVYASDPPSTNYVRPERRETGLRWVWRLEWPVRKGNGRVDLDVILCIYIYIIYIYIIYIYIYV